jgi:hypothetical protein
MTVRKRSAESHQPCVFLPAIDGEKVVQLFTAFKRRGFGRREKILDSLAELFCGNYRSDAALVDVLKSDMWVGRLTQMGVLPEAREGLIAAVAACFAEQEQQFEIAKSQVANALVQLLPAHAANVAARTEQDRLEVAALRTSFTLMLFEAQVGPDCFSTELFFKLQESPLKEQFVRVYGSEPTVPSLRKFFGLSAETCRALSAAKAAAWAASQQRFRESVHAAAMPEKLGITKTEFNRWRADGRIPVTFYCGFQKWGANLETTRHHPDELAHITPELIETWRTSDRKPRAGR